MQGQTVNFEDLQNCTNELQTAASVAQALVPSSLPMYMSDTEFGLEMKFINMLYHMTRCVSAMSPISDFAPYPPFPVSSGMYRVMSFSTLLKGVGEEIIWNRKWGKKQSLQILHFLRWCRIYYYDC